VPVIRYRDGSTGFVTADLGYGNSADKHMLAFESRRDAEEVQYLFQANTNEHTAMVRVVPMKPDQILETASSNEMGVAVYAPGQLQLKPGMTVDQIGEAAVACR